MGQGPKVSFYRKPFTTLGQRKVSSYRKPRRIPAAFCHSIMRQLHREGKAAIAKSLSR